MAQFPLARSDVRRLDFREAGQALTQINLPEDVAATGDRMRKRRHP
jgi:hypothetical protein